MPTNDLPWYIARNQTHKMGPFFWPQIRQMAENGMLQLSDMLIQEGSQRWQEITDFIAPDGVPTGRTATTDNTLFFRPESLVMLDHKHDLLNLLRNLPASGFERLCQRLLEKSGFDQVEVTGKSGDGGIDGIGNLKVNAFVTFKVFFQCKRYSGNVGSPEVVNFKGAMSGRGAVQGILLTTGGFTESARKEANRDGATPIKLIGSKELLQLCENLRFGLVPRTTFDVDREFFREFRNPA